MAGAGAAGRTHPNIGGLISDGTSTAHADADDAYIGSLTRGASPTPAGPVDDMRSHENTGPLGITWLELYIIYRLAGHPETVPYTNASARTRPTLRQQLTAFRQTIRQVVQQTMDSSHHGLFVGQPSKGRRLATLGVSTNLAVLPWQPYIAKDLQDRVAQEVLRSQHRLTLAKATQAMAAKQQVRIHTIQLKGRAKWAKGLKPYKGPFYKASTGDTTGSSTDTHRPCMPTNPPIEPPTKRARTLPTLIFLQCPKCPHKLPGTRSSFQDHNLDSKVWCKQCHCSRLVKQWQCTCGVPWHLCPLHKDEPARLRSQQPTPPPPKQRFPAAKAGGKAKLTKGMGQGRDTAVQRWLDSPAPKRHKPAPAEVELEATMPPTKPNPNFMGPKLQARFLTIGPGPTSSTSTTTAIRAAPPPPPPPW